MERKEELSKLNKADLVELLLATEAENEALKATEGLVATKEPKLSTEERIFEVEIPVKTETKETTKKVKALLEDVPKLYVAGTRYTQAAFLADDTVKQAAVLMKHPSVKVLK